MRSQSLYLGITFLFVFMVHLKAQDPRDSPLAILLAHNIPRAEVGVGPLIWDEKVAAHARLNVNKLKEKCNLKQFQGPYGESIAWRAGSMTAVEAIKMWVDEKDNYDYESNTCSWAGKCEEYTQVVWRNTHRVGCAKVKCNNKPGTIFICNYDPPGSLFPEKPY